MFKILPSAVILIYLLYIFHQNHDHFTAGMPDVPGFDALYKRILRKMKIEDKAPSTCVNYCRCLAQLALYFKITPSELDTEQVEEYLFGLINNGVEGINNRFKFTVYGLRYGLQGGRQKQINVALPSIRNYRRLPTSVKQGRSSADA